MLNSNGKGKKQKKETPDYWCKKGEQSYDKKDFETASRFFSNALKLAKNVDALNGKGLALLEQNKLKKAFAYFKEALLIDKHNLLAFHTCLHIINELFDQEDFIASEITYNQIRRINPQHPSILNFWEKKSDTLYPQQSNPGSKTDCSSGFYTSRTSHRQRNNTTPSTTPRDVQRIQDFYSSDENNPALEEEDSHSQSNSLRS